MSSLWPRNLQPRPTRRGFFIVGGVLRPGLFSRAGTKLSRQSRFGTRRKSRQSRQARQCVASPISSDRGGPPVLDGGERGCTAAPVPLPSWHPQANARRGPGADPYRGVYVQRPVDLFERMVPCPRCRSLPARRTDPHRPPCTTRDAGRVTRSDLDPKPIELLSALRR